MWLWPKRGLVGWFELEAHCEPPGTSRETKFTRASRSLHVFRRLEADGITIHYDFGRKGEPDELHLERKGLRNGTHRIEAFWDGSLFVDAQLPDGDRLKPFDTGE